jgi:MYXO-CTERM domain-containing protein
MAHWIRGFTVRSILVPASCLVFFGCSRDTAPSAVPASLALRAPTASWRVEGDQEGAFFGTSVASAGDLNGDGYPDVVVGEPGFVLTGSSDGQVSVWYGSASGLAPTADWTYASPSEHALLGLSVASAGDVNGDGFDDLIVGAPSFNGAHFQNGAAYVFLGSGFGLSSTPDWTIEGDRADEDMGWSVASAGDVDADGFDDVIIGAMGYENGEVSEGAAFVYRGSAAGLEASPVWSAESNMINSGYGFSVASAGDVDGDGFDDIAVGAPYANYPDSLSGAAFLYRGSAAGPEPTASWSAGGSATSMFGQSVASADTNGDGSPDLVVGEYILDAQFENGGGISVFLGGVAGLSALPDVAIRGDGSYAELGYSVASVGDVNGDGYADVVAGAWTASSPEDGEGAALLFLGSATGLVGSPEWKAEPDRAHAGMGGSVAAAGDVNGDGYADVLVGAAGFADPEKQEGEAILFLGECIDHEADADADGVGDRCDRCPGHDDRLDVDGDGVADGCDDDAPDTGGAETGATGGTGTPGGTDDADDPGSASDPFHREPATGGCGCDHSGAGTPGLALVLAALVGLRRRR